MCGDGDADVAQLNTSLHPTTITVCVCAYICSLECMCGDGDADVAQLVEHWTGTPLTQVRFPGAARDFSPRVNFQS